MNAEVVIALVIWAGCVLFYLGLLYAVSYTDGWRSLARHFAVRPGDDRPREFRKFVSAHLQGVTIWHGVHFDYSVRTVQTATGLYIVPHWWVRFGHQLLFIPWDALASVQLRTVSWPHAAHRGEYVELTFAADDVDRRLLVSASALTLPVSGGSELAAS